jgi:hypothetical protein
LEQERDGGVAHVVEHLPSKPRAQIPVLPKFLKKKKTIKSVTNLRVKEMEYKEQERELTFDF